MIHHDVIDVHCGWGATLSAADWTDPVAVRETLRARGVGMTFLASDLARRYDPIAGNAQVDRVATENSGALRGWLVLHPGRLEDAVQQMRQYLYEDHFVGAALFSDAHHGQIVTYRNAIDIVNSYRRYSKPLLIETPSAAAMYEAAHLADEARSVRFIASGMGGAEWREAIDIALRPVNLFLDISGELVPDKVAYLLRQNGGNRKLLFGSGAPHTDPAAVLGMLDEVEMNGDDRERLLFSNARHLFRLDTTGAAKDEADELIPFDG